MQGAGAGAGEAEALVAMGFDRDLVLSVLQTTASFDAALSALLAIGTAEPTRPGASPGIPGAGGGAAVGVHELD